MSLIAMILVSIVRYSTLVPAVQLRSSLIYAFASVAVTIFFFSSHKQS